MDCLTIIAGCGYLGAALARRLQESGSPVLGLTHSGESAAALNAAGIPAMACDLADPASCGAVAARAGESRKVRVAHTAAGGRGGGAEQYEAVHVRGTRNLREALPGLRRMVFTSSTSVYPQTDGEWVTESSPAEPGRETGRILRRAEEETLAAGGVVARLAGIYGPDRSVLLRNFLTGAAAVETRPDAPDGRWLNQIHRDDAAAALALLLDAPEEAVAGEIFNVCDSQPLTQRALYAEMARRFRLPEPPEGTPDFSRKRGWTNKRVSSSRLAALGWRPAYPSWTDALERDPAFLSSILSQLPSEACVPHPQTHSVQARLLRPGVGEAALPASQPVQKDPDRRGEARG